MIRVDTAILTGWDTPTEVRRNLVGSYEMTDLYKQYYIVQ